MRRSTIFYTAILSLAVHGLLLFGSSSSSKVEANSVHFSTVSSQRIQVKRMLKIRKESSQPKKLMQEKSRAKKVMAKKTNASKQQVVESAIRPTKQVSTGQQNEKARYLKQVRDQILAKKRYPRIAKMLKKQGVVDIYFEVSYPKNLSNIQIQKGSGHAILDKSALETIESLEGLPEMPDFLKSEVLKVAIPIKYELL